LGAGAVFHDTQVRRCNAMQCSAVSIQEAGPRPLIPAHSKS